MSAPKRTQANTPYPPKEQISFRARVLGYPGAKTAFDKLANAGFDKRSLWDWLWRLARANRDFTSARKRAPRRWYALHGYPPHTLRRFPDRLRRTAEEIEKLNARIQSDGVFRAAVEFLTAIAKGPVSEPRDLDLRSLDKLPGLLRHYGDYIALWTGW
jgi:hypothetical protein